METIIGIFKNNLAEHGKVELSRDLAESIVAILEKEIEIKYIQIARINNYKILLPEKTE